MNLLRIYSSARIENSKTRMLTDFFIKELKQKNTFSLESRDVGTNPPNFPTNEFIKANYTPKVNRTNKMKNILKPSDLLIRELFNADKIIIASPMYNFSISTTLKAYIDTIIRVGKTFQLNKNGTMQGLLNKKKVIVITSRGAMSYKTGEAFHSFDFQENYLRAIFQFLGITDILFVHAEAQDFGSEELKIRNFKQAKEQLTNIAKIW